MTHPARRNRLLNTLEMRRRDLVMRSRPYSVQLEVTTKCNLACIMCARDKYHGRGTNLTDDVLEPVLRELFPTAHDVIVSSFGEPLLYPGIRRLFAEIPEESGLKLGFYTNFLLMDEEMAEHIIRSGVAYINASIDGASKESYEAIRKGGEWKTLLEKLKMFQRVKRRMRSETPEVNLCVVGSTLNIDEAARFVEMAKQYGFASVKYNPNMYVDEEEMDYLSLVHEQEKTVLKFREAHRRAVELDVHTNFHRKPFKVDAPDDALPPAEMNVNFLLNQAKRLWRHGIGWRLGNTWDQGGGTAKGFVYLGAIKARDKVIDNIPVVGSARRKVPIPHTIPNDAPPRSCGNPWTHVHVKSDGLVYPCCFSDEVMGDLRRQSFEEIWNGEKYQDLRRSMKTKCYWASCRRASCNWVEGAHSSIYGAKITPLRKVEKINGQQGETIPLKITNTSRFGWNPSEQHKPKENALSELLASDDEKMIRENTKDSRITVSYRLLNEKDELVDEGEHQTLPQDVLKGQTIETELKVRPVRFAGKMTLKIDLVHEGVTWFGERGNYAVEIPVEVVKVPFAAWLGTWQKHQLRAAVDRLLKPGEEMDLPIRVTNVGAEPFDPETDFLSYHWKRHDGEYAEWEGLRTELPAVAPGEQADVKLKVRVPKDLEIGRYDLEIDVLRDGVEWLSQAWNRPLLSYPARVGLSQEDEQRLADRDARGKLIVWEEKGQCVTNTGNKGIW